VGRVLATQFHPRKVAAIDTAPKGRMKRDRSAVAAPKTKIGTYACYMFIWNDLWKIHYQRLNHFNLILKIPTLSLIRSHIESWCQK